jgi:hypothetical protein
MIEVNNIESHPSRKYAEWYCNVKDRPILTYTDNDLTVEVWVEGETEYFDSDTGIKCIHPSQFFEIGIKDDKGMDELPESGWENNSWYAVRVLLGNSKTYLNEEHEVFDEMIFHSLGEFFDVLENLIQELDMLSLDN